MVKIATLRQEAELLKQQTEVEKMKKELKELRGEKPLLEDPQKVCTWSEIVHYSVIQFQIWQWCSVDIAHFLWIYSNALFYYNYLWGIFARLLLWLSSQSFNLTNRFSTQRFLLSYEDYEYWSGRSRTHDLPPTRCSTNWATGARFWMVCSFFRICLLPKCCVLSDIQKKQEKRRLVPWVFELLAYLNSFPSKSLILNFPFGQSWRRFYFKIYF